MATAPQLPRQFPQPQDTPLLGLQTGFTIFYTAFFNHASDGTPTLGSVSAS